MDKQWDKKFVKICQKKSDELAKVWPLSKEDEKILESQSTESKKVNVMLLFLSNKRNIYGYCSASSNGSEASQEWSKEKIWGDEGQALFFSALFWGTKVL